MENKVESIDRQKLRGGYYTPESITQFICEWAINQPDLEILEPSCGDGNFIVAAIRRLLALGADASFLTGKVQGVELIEDESAIASRRAKELGLNSNTIVHSDFFSFAEALPEGRKFDVIIGNPPFIRYQNFPPVHREKAIRMMHEIGLSPNKLTNIWVPFLVISAALLSENGKLGMVIPAELFQVKYASETRVFLSRYFDRVSIINFKRLVFEGIQQEVVLLLCEKNVQDQQGIRVLEIEDLDALNAFNVERFASVQVKQLDHSTEKWTKYYLTQYEIDLLREIRKLEVIQPASESLEVDVGIVSGRNAFFMMNKDQVKAWNLAPFVKKVVGRSPHLRGLVFSNMDFDANADSNLNCYLFVPPDLPFEELPTACQRYVEYGEENNFHTGYKCRIRKRWYITPSLWTPDGFALRQINEFPKLIINEAEASSTDTIHRVRFKDPEQAQILSLSFLNSLTFAFSEITGRSYGGGVLTFEPTEVEALPLPFHAELGVDRNHVDGLLRKKEIEKVLDILDHELLISRIGLEKETVSQLRGIWKKMRDRRLYRKRKRTRS